MLYRLPQPQDIPSPAEIQEVCELHCGNAYHDILNGLREWESEFSKPTTTPPKPKKLKSRILPPEESGQTIEMLNNMLLAVAAGITATMVDKYVMTPLFKQVTIPVKHWSERIVVPAATIKCPIHNLVIEGPCYMCTQDKAKEEQWRQSSLNKK